MIKIIYYLSYSKSNYVAVNLKSYNWNESNEYLPTNFEVKELIMQSSPDNQCF